MRSEPGDKEAQRRFRWTANSPSAADNGRVIAETLKTFYLSLSISPADFYLKLPPSCLGDSRWSFLPLRCHPFSPGRRVQWPNQRLLRGNQLGVMTKTPCNKGLLCNLMGSETVRNAHFNELRSPFYNHSAGGNGKRVLPPWKEEQDIIHPGCSVVSREPEK